MLWGFFDLRSAGNRLHEMVPVTNTNNEMSNGAAQGTGKMRLCLRFVASLRGSAPPTLGQF